MCSSHGDYFIAKNNFSDGHLTKHVLKHPDRNVLILFPEGGFWRKRLEGSNRYALKNGLPMTKYVTHPRFGAFKDLIDGNVGVTHIVDATLLYNDIRKPVSILDIVLGNRKELALLHCKIYSRDEVDPSEDWLRKLWLQKDKFMQNYYDNPGKQSVKHKVHHTSKIDWIKVILVHIFFLAVCYITIYRLFNATSVTMHKVKEIFNDNIHNNFHLFRNAD